MLGSEILRPLVLVTHLDTVGNTIGICCIDTFLPQKLLYVLLIEPSIDKCLNKSFAPFIEVVVFTLIEKVVIRELLSHHMGRFVLNLHRIDTLAAEIVHDLARDESQSFMRQKPLVMDKVLKFDHVDVVCEGLKLV